MKILLTEATSEVAYHLLPMLASGDIFCGQKIELVLCACVEASQELEGLVYELQDCGFPTVAEISVTDNFTESCKTSDVIIALPSQMPTKHRHGNIEVNISNASLTQMDFERLNNAMFPDVSPKHNACSVKSHGAMSTANAISQYLSRLHGQSLQAIQRDIENRREEAEFGCPPDPSIVDVITPQSYYLSRDLLVQKKTMIISVIATKVDDDMLIDEDNLDGVESFSKLYSRL